MENLVQRIGSSKMARSTSSADVPARGARVDVLRDAGQAGMSASTVTASTSSPPPPPPPPPEVVDPPTRWALAWAAAEDKHPEIMSALRKRLPTSAGGSQDPDDTIKFVQGALDEREAKKLIVKVFGKSVGIREEVENVVKFILWTRDFIKAVVKTDPHAAIAWAGVSFLLPVSLNLSIATAIYVTSIHLTNSAR